MEPPELKLFKEEGEDNFILLEREGGEGEGVSCQGLPAMMLANYYPKMNGAQIWNCLTLCLKCHRKFDLLRRTKFAHFLCQILQPHCQGITVVGVTWDL